MFGLSPLPRTLPAALADLAHKKPAVRRSALRDLARFGDGPERRRAVHAIAGVLVEDASAELRAEAALALADLRATEVRAELERALADSQPRVRELALLALVELADPGDPELLAKAEKLFAGGEPSLRFQALIALERLSPDRADQPLEQASRDTDPELRSMAFRLAEERLGSGGSPAPGLVEQARACLEDELGPARVSAALLLGALGDASGEPTLVAVIDGQGAGLSLADVQAAIELAGELGLRSALAGLRRRAFGWLGPKQDGLGWHARIALARLGDDRAKRALVAGLSSWTRDGRTLAAVAVGRARLAEARPSLLELAARPGGADPEALAEALAEIEGRPGSKSERSRVR